MEIIERDPKSGKFVDRSGEDHEHFTVRRFVGFANKQPVWECRCKVCGKVFLVRANSLQRQQSCGCLWKKGYRDHPYLHTAWKRYKFSEIWDDFKSFVDCVGKRPHLCYLRKKKEDQPWSKDNFEWSKIRGSKHGRFIAYNGETKNMADWAAQLGISRERMRQRLEVMPAEEALSYGKLTGKAISDSPRFKRIFAIRQEFRELRRKEMIAKYDAGTPIEQIAEDCDLSYSTIRHYLQGMFRIKRKKYNQERNQEIAKKFTNGASIEGLADEYGLCQNTIRLYIGEAHRDAREAKRQEIREKFKLGASVEDLAEEYGIHPLTAKKYIFGKTRGKFVRSKEREQERSEISNEIYRQFKAGVKMIDVASNMGLSYSYTLLLLREKTHKSIVQLKKSRWKGKPRKE